MSELYRAVMEGLTYEMAYNLEVLSEFGISTSRMFAAGGGAFVNMAADKGGHPEQGNRTCALRGSRSTGRGHPRGEFDRPIRQH